jgi:hypothetical protein
MSSRSPLPDVWQVPQVFRSRLRESVGRQRAMSADGHLLLVLHAPPKPNEPKREARLFWRAPDGAWRGTLGPRIAALQQHLAEYDALLATLDEAADRADRADDFLAILHAIAPLRRSTRNLYETLQEAREMAADDADLIVCRDQAYALQRRAELIESETRAGLDCAVARRAEEQAEYSHRMALASHRLNVLAAMFLPLATLSSVFSMSLRPGLDPYDRSPWLFWSIVLAGLVAGFCLALFLTRRKRKG